MAKLMGDTEDDDDDDEEEEEPEEEEESNSEDESESEESEEEEEDDAQTPLAKQKNNLQVSKIVINRPRIDFNKKSRFR